MARVAKERSAGQDSSTGTKDNANASPAVRYVLECNPPESSAKDKDVDFM